jgi:hypothetical protein
MTLACTLIISTACWLVVLHWVWPSTQDRVHSEPGERICMLLQTSCLRITPDLYFPLYSPLPSPPMNSPRGGTSSTTSCSPPPLQHLLPECGGGWVGVTRVLGAPPGLPHLPHPAAGSSTARPGGMELHTVGRQVLHSTSHVVLFLRATLSRGAWDSGTGCGRGM